MKIGNIPTNTKVKYTGETTTAMGWMAFYNKYLKDMKDSVADDSIKVDFKKDDTVTFTKDQEYQSVYGGQIVGNLNVKDGVQEQGEKKNFTFMVFDNGGFIITDDTEKDYPYFTNLGVTLDGSENNLMQKIKFNLSKYYLPITIAGWSITAILAFTKWKKSKVWKGIIIGSAALNGYNTYVFFAKRNDGGLVNPIASGKSKNNAKKAK